MGSTPLLVEAPETWPGVHVDRAVGSPTTRASAADEGGARLRLVTGGEMLLERDPPRMLLRTDAAIPDDELVHPYLAAGIAWFAHWRGRQALHAGAFEAGGRAWGLLAAKEGGKSTLVAHLHQRGERVLADDLLVLEEGSAYAGPRCVDLREDTAARLGDLGVARSRTDTRLRLRLGPVAPELPLGGFVFLEWGPRLELERLPAGERLGRLNLFRTALRWDSDPVGLLDAAAHPAWVLRRPRRWDALAATADRLLETVTA